MSELISIFLGWAANTFMLSGLLFAFFSILRLFKIRATSRYIFLKGSFLLLPPLPLLSEGLSYFSRYFRGAGSIESSSSGLYTKLDPLQTNVPHYIHSSQTFGLIALGLLLLYLFSVLRGIARIGYSIYSISNLKKSSVSRKLNGSIEIYVHDRPIAPAAAGIWNPSILISQSLLSEISAQDLELIVEHEATHLRRRDPLFNALRLFVKELLVFSPFVHWLSKVFEEEMEISLDETILKNRESERRAYGSLLLRLCGHENDSLTMTCNGLFKSVPFIKRRIENMKDFNKRPVRKNLMISLLAGFLVSSALLVPTLGLADKSKIEVSVGSPANEYVKKYCGESPCSKEFRNNLVEAENGSAEAQNQIGVSLHFGKGVKQDYFEALKWYLRAVEKHHAEAANHIGRIYLNGEGVSKNTAEACSWYVKSGEWGHVWGMMNAASCYEHGDRGFAKDEAKANEWYQRAAKAQPGILKEYEKLNARNQKKNTI